MRGAGVITRLVLGVVVLVVIAFVGWALCRAGADEPYGRP
jgi:hypothetical protein